MLAVLMLCNTPVYDIAENRVLKAKFCPFTALADTKRSYEMWSANRAYLRTNRIAEQIVTQAGGFSTREAKRRLSLSDGYWVLYSYDRDITFESITPYLNPFSSKAGKPSSSIPELTLGGSQPKNWERGSDGLIYMVKVEAPDQVHAEMLSVKLARLCGIPVMNAFIETEAGRTYADNYTSLRMGHGVINLVNMTSVAVSLLQIDQLGISIRGTDPVSVAEAYVAAGVLGDVGVQALLQVVFDAIVGNPDRETNDSNWAVFMDNSTGKRTPSWLYDFNWANTKIDNESGIFNIVEYIKRAGLETKAIKQAEYIGLKCAELGLAVWERNARMLISKLMVK